MSKFKYFEDESAYNEVKAKFDERSLRELTDDDNDGQPDPEVIDKTIQTREDVFEGYAVLRHPDLTQLRNEKPRQAQLWILSMVIYDIYGRRNAVPIDKENDYQQTIQELQAFAKNGVPQLISATTVAQGSPAIKTNMTRQDLGEATENGEPLVWSEMK